MHWPWNAAGRRTNLLQAGTYGAALIMNQHNRYYYRICLYLNYRMYPEVSSSSPSSSYTLLSGYKLVPGLQVVTYRMDRTRLSLSASLSLSRSWDLVPDTPKRSSALHTAHSLS